MSDDLTFQVAFTERERFYMATFFTRTYKPADKPARKAMRLVYRRLKLDDMMDRLSKPPGVNTSLLRDAWEAITMNEETLNWLIERIFKTPTEGIESIFLSEIEDRLDLVRDKKYVLPEGAVPAK
jgi:hypothetical protein